MPPPTGVGPPPAASAHSVKLKLKYLNNNAEKPSKLKVFETIFKTLNSQLTKLIPIDTGYIAPNRATPSVPPVASPNSLKST